MCSHTELSAHLGFESIRTGDGMGMGRAVEIRKMWMKTEMGTGMSWEVCKGRNETVSEELELGLWRGV